MLFGNVWDETEVSVSSMDLNFDLQQARFFLGDRWYNIGPISHTTIRDKQGLIMQVNMEHLDEFMERKLLDNDGSEDWMEWGPRVN